MENMKARLSTLWIFAMFNYLYCDVLALMNSGYLKQVMAGNVGGIHINCRFPAGSQHIDGDPHSHGPLVESIGLPGQSLGKYPGQLDYDGGPDRDAVHGLADDLLRLLQRDRNCLHGIRGLVCLEVA